MSNDYSQHENHEFEPGMCRTCQEIVQASNLTGQGSVESKTPEIEGIKTPDQPQADELALPCPESKCGTPIDKILKGECGHCGFQDPICRHIAHDEIEDLITREREQAKREVLEAIEAAAAKGESRRKFILAALTPNEPKEAE